MLSLSSPWPKAHLCFPFIVFYRKSSQKAVIVNVSSELGSIADRLDPESPYYKLANEIIAYSSSKTALNGITAHYTRNLPEMRVVSVTPGELSKKRDGIQSRSTLLLIFSCALSSLSLLRILCNCSQSLLWVQHTSIWSRSHWESRFG